MDGVLAAFDQDYERRTGAKWDHRATWTKEKKWAMLKEHPFFFRDLPWMKGARVTLSGSPGIYKTSKSSGMRYKNARAVRELGRESTMSPSEAHRKLVAEGHFNDSHPKDNLTPDEEVSWDALGRLLGHDELRAIVYLGYDLSMTAK